MRAFFKIGYFDIDERRYGADDASDAAHRNGDDRDAYGGVLTVFTNASATV